MRHHVNIVLCVASAVVILCPESTSAQANWREVRSLKMGRFFARVDVSSVHTVRLYAQLDTSRLEQLVQYPIDFKLNAVLPVKPFEVSTRRPTRRPPNF